MRKILLRPDGDDACIEVALERAETDHGARYRAALGERHVDFDMARRDGRSGWLRLQGRIVPFRAVRSTSSVEVWVAGRRFVFEIVDRTARRTSETGRTAASNDLTAPMPGTILEIHARPGATFPAHEALIVMESMKMEMTLSAPAPMTVSEVLCREGELVEMGAILARLEPAHADETVETAARS